MRAPPTPYSVLAQSERFFGLFAHIDERLQQYIPNVFRTGVNIVSYYQSIGDTTAITPDFVKIVAAVYTALGWKTEIEGDYRNFTIMFNI